MPAARLWDAPAESVDRARSLWSDLERHFVRRRPWGRLATGAGGRRAQLWPLSQVLHAAAALSPLGTVDVGWERLLGGLRGFETQRGWTATAWPRRRRVFHDDNAWLGLALEQSALFSGDEGARAIARRACAAAEAGRHISGGVRWHEETGALHACSTAPSVMLALRLRGPGAADVATTSLEWLDRTLTRRDGLIVDHVTATGQVVSDVWSYNQGSAIGAHLLAWRVLGWESSRARAWQLAERAVAHYDAARLWSEPPAFTAVLLRQLMALDAHLASRRWQGYVDRYLERLWVEGRDRETGLVTAGGIGRYDDGVVLDQAAAVQLFAFQAMPVPWRRLIC